MRVVAPLCAAVVLFAAACAPKEETAVKDSAAPAAAPAVDPVAVRQAIDQANAKLAEAFPKGDTATIMSLYDNDAVVMMTGQPAWRGKADISKQGAGFLEAVKLSDIKFTTSNVDIAGDYAIETGNYELTATEKGKKPVPDKGKYVVVWKKQGDGSWKVYRDVSNSDGAAK